MNTLSLIQKIAVYALPLLFAIVLHEVAHGWVAFRFGDSTAKALGRLTLNPLKHIDPIGTVAVPLIMLASTQFIFGWAKPVPISWGAFKHPKRDFALVALAGPFANLLMAFFWAGVLKIALFSNPAHSEIAKWAFYTGKAGLFINIILMVLNLVPIPPLDGSRLLLPFLSPKLETIYHKLEPFGILILIALLITGLLGNLIYPTIISIVKLILAFYGVGY